MVTSDPFSPLVPPYLPSSGAEIQYEIGQDLIKEIGQGWHQLGLYLEFYLRVSVSGVCFFSANASGICSFGTNASELGYKITDVCHRCLRAIMR